MKKAVVFIFGFFLLSGCALGLKSIIVPNLSYILSTRTADRLDLFYNQEKKLKKDIEKIFAESKPKIIELRKVIAEIDIEKSNENEIFEKIKNIVFEVMVPFNKVLGKYASLLNKDQQKAFFKNEKEQNEKLQKKIVSKDFESIFERYEFFLGDLTSTQKNIIKENQEVYKRLYQNRLKRRLETQEEMRLQYKKPLGNLETIFGQLFGGKFLAGQNDPEQLNGLKVLSQIKKTLSKKQKTHFREKQKEILEWIDEFLKRY